ncbi:MAG: AMP-binding protein [Terriglobales bacterium]
MALESLSTFVAGLEHLGPRPLLIEQELYRVRRHSYQSLLRRAFAVMDDLRRHGIGRGDCALIWGPAGAAWVAAFYACLMSGVVLVPVDAAFSADYALRAQNHTHARMVIAPAARCASLARFAPGLETLSFEAIAAMKPRAGADGPPVAPLGPETLLEIVYTSGTTAEPKGVMITHGNVLANLRSLESEVRKIRRWAKPLMRVGFVHIIPLSHLFGQVVGLMLPPLLEARVIFVDSQTPQALTSALRQHAASMLICVPQQMQLLADWAVTQSGSGPAAVPSAQEIVAETRRHWFGWRFWRWRRVRGHFGLRMWAFIVGGASLAPELEDLWGAFGYSVIQGYGLTETAPAITATHPFKVRRGAVGRRLAEAEIKINADGEILVRGPMVTPGYFRNPEATAAMFSDGWLRTGDLGRLDEEGNLTFLGRKKEVIVTAEGLNIYPQDVEAALNQQPAIRDSAVVAEEVDHQPRVHAVLVPAPVLDEAEATAVLESAVHAANHQLEPHQRVRGFSVWPDHELPRTASTHKIQRVAIRDWVNRRPVAASALQDRGDWREFLAAKLRIPESALTPERGLDELGLGSLDRVELLTWLETRAGIPVDEAALTEARTIGDLAALVAAASPGGEAAVARPVRLELPAAARVPAGPFRYPRWPIAAPTRGLRGLGYNTIVFPVLRSHVRMQIEGRENLRGVRRPVLFIANHQSRFDVPAILRALPSHWRPWLAPAMGARDFREFLRPAGYSEDRRRAAYWKYVLTQAFFNGYLLAAEGGIRNALRYTGLLADKGFCPLIFPEGQETPDGRLHPFRPGIGVFVHELRLPVVPIAIEGLFEILPIGAKWPRRGVARVTIGPLREFRGQQPAEVTAALQDWFEQRIAVPVAVPARV